MKLKYFLKKAEISEKAFAAKCGVHQTTMHRYTSGDVEPSFKMMRKIYVESDQIVTPNDFVL